jgi:Ni,Fe-hydrogenase III large subunit
MSAQSWMNDYLDALGAAGVRILGDDPEGLAPARRLVVEAGDWDSAGRVAAETGLRWAGAWADPFGEEIRVHACLEEGGHDLVLEARIPAERPEIPSHAPWFAGADRLERHIHDLTGVVFTGHPDPRRWTRHQAWEADHFPLQPDFPAGGYPPAITPADTDYPFVPVKGSGVYEIPVGPVHAGIIEPGHFRFHANGEDVLRLEERLGYVHKGIEKIAVDRDPEGLARLAGRVSGDSTVAHAWAACQAMERAAGAEIPARARYLRALLAERERIANHLGDVGAICNDVGFAFAHAQCGALREAWQRNSQALFGHRLLMDAVVPGGVARDIDARSVRVLRAEAEELRRKVRPLFDILTDHPPLDDRLITTGRLSAETALSLGATGHVGKASGLDRDLRRDAAYPPYDDLDVNVPVFQDGDVSARMRVRIEEIGISLALVERLLERLPAGAIRAELPLLQAGASGLGRVEGWRGDILTYVRFGEDGRIARFFPRDPSWFSWPALERIILGNIVPDFPVCNKSVNGSYSGVDL